MRYWFPLSVMILFPVVALSVPPGQAKYDALRARYLKLRNTDSQVNREPDWERLANDMLGYVGRFPQSKNAASLLYDASIVYEKLFKKSGSIKRARRAATLLDRLARDYPGHMLVDDALVRRGDLAMHVLRDVKAARRSYQEVIDAYPDSDMHPIARLRIEQLERGDDYRPGSGKPEKVVAREKRTKPLILLDPGHGGEDFGAVGLSGMMEKDVTLAVAFELEKLLEKDLGATVRLTRRNDTFVPLMERTHMANDFEADLFVSLHANASVKGKLSGFEVYYLDNHGDRSTRALAKRENSSVRLEGPAGDLHYMLSDLIQNAKLDESIAFANTVYGSVMSTLKPRWGQLKGLGVKRAPFYVLVGAHMPCILVEMFFLDNKTDGKLLADTRFRKDLAKGMSNGIASFLKQSKSPS